jgi:ankyrin repeat protein
LRVLLLGGVAQAAAVAPVDSLEPVRLAIRQKQFPEAFSRLEGLSEKGNPQAQYLLGSMLLANPLGEPDMKGASRWLSQSAAAGSARAAYLLAVIAATATPADETAARTWLQTAAKGGFEPAEALVRANRLPLQFLPAEDLETAQARGAALLRAARRNDVQTLQRLVSVVQPGQVDDFGRTALAQAAEADAADAVVWLLGQGMPVDARDSFGATALMLAAKAPHAKTLAMLLGAGAAATAVDSAGNTALHLASRIDDGQRVRHLLAAGALTNVANQDGDRPLDIALQAEATEVARILREAGAQPGRAAAVRNEALTQVNRAKGNADAYAGRGDLEVAASRRDTGMLKAMLAADKLGQSAKNAALLAAVEAGTKEAVVVLLAAGANARVTDTRLRSPLHVAVLQRDKEIVDLLLAAGADASAAGSSGAPLLIEAVSAGSEGIAEQLLIRGARVDAADSQGRTALMLAAARADARMLEMLLKHGANATRRDRLGRSVLLHAALGGTSAQVQRLLAAGAEAKLADQDGNTPLSVVAARGEVESLRALLAAGAEMDAVTRGGSTALMQAAAADQLEPVRALLVAGAKVAPRDQQGDTVLTIAARDSSPALIKALLAAGADRNVRNGNRANAQEIAQELHREAVAAVFAAD